ncbi:hypothetical protein NQ314_014532 [Rhamnusium bicolor]|uniref:Uncharacterized protein n=1 Tax=Rhamnusium bicolor TaxID=1586634 RepID=A0AAV8X1W6_9CUCU|nr:hypothetical protein NQ314_014532 [Rhamnusium bicolor]
MNLTRKIGIIIKKIRNAVDNLLKLKEQQFYYNEIDKNKGDPYLMWKTFKKLINPKTFNNNFHMGIQFDDDGVTILCKNELDIAENFNKYFIQSIKEIVDSIDDHEYKASNKNYTDSF